MSDARYCAMLRWRPAVYGRSDVGVNKLSGSLPDSMGSLTALTYLCVHRGLLLLFASSVRH